MAGLQDLASTDALIVSHLSLPCTKPQTYSYLTGPEYNVYFLVIRFWWMYYMIFQP